MVLSRLRSELEGDGESSLAELVGLVVEGHNARIAALESKVLELSSINLCSKCSNEPLDKE